MTTPVEKLTKILHLEAEKCQDRAVLGGMARYAETWSKETKDFFKPEATEWIRKVADRLKGYVVEKNQPPDVVVGLLGIFASAKICL